MLTSKAGGEPTRMEVAMAAMTGMWANEELVKETTVQAEKANVDAFRLMAHSAFKAADALLAAEEETR